MHLPPPSYPFAFETTRRSGRPRAARTPRGARRLQRRPWRADARDSRRRNPTSNVRRLRHRSASLRSRRPAPCPPGQPWRAGSRRSAATRRCRPRSCRTRAHERTRRRRRTRAGRTASRACPRARRRGRACRVRADSPRAPGRAPRGSGWHARLPWTSKMTARRPSARSTSSLWWRRRTGAPKREAAGELFRRMPRRRRRPRTEPTPRPPSRRTGNGSMRMRPETRAEILATRNSRDPGERSAPRASPRPRVCVNRQVVRLLTRDCPPPAPSRPAASNRACVSYSRARGGTTGWRFGAASA